MTNRSSVLVVSHAGDVWGAERRLLDIAPLLADHGIDLTLATAPGALAETWTAAGHPWVALDTGERRGLRQGDSRKRPGPGALLSDAGAVLAASVRIARIARSFDLVQSHSLMAHLEVALAGRLARRPVVLDLHDLVEEGLGRRVLGLAARLATTSLANSEATAGTVGGANGKVHVVHPGVDTDRFFPGPGDTALRAQLSARPDAPLVGILGRVDPNKGVQILVEAMALAQGDDDLSDDHGKAHLVVIGREHVGTADFAVELRRRAEELLGDRVRFMGPRDDVPDLLRAMDIMVNASRHEPFGRTVLEAQACGVAVVATDAGGIPEFVADGRTGLLVPPFDVPALAAALTRLVRDEAMRLRLADAGASQARECFSVESQARAAADVYRHALGEAVRTP